MIWYAVSVHVNIGRQQFDCFAGMALSSVAFGDDGLARQSHLGSDT